MYIYVYRHIDGESNSYHEKGRGSFKRVRRKVISEVGLIEKIFNENNDT